MSICEATKNERHKLIELEHTSWFWALDKLLTSNGYNKEYFGAPGPQLHYYNLGTSIDSDDSYINVTVNGINSAGGCGLLGAEVIEIRHRFNKIFIQLRKS